MEKLLYLSTSCTFYKVKNKKIPKNFISALIKEVTQRKDGNFIQKKIRIGKKTVGENFEYSLAIFKVLEEATFIKESSLIEQKFGYFLLIEYKGFLIIKSKYTLNFKNLVNKYAEPIEYEIFSQFLFNEETNFERINTKNMDISNTAIRKRSVEANSLKESYLPISSSKQIVNSIGFSNKERKYSITTNSARLTEKQGNVDFNEFCFWGVELINTILSYKPIDNYLTNFAKPKSLVNEMLNLIPSSILFDFAELENSISSIDKIMYKKESLITNKMLLHLLQRGTTFFEIDSTEASSFKVISSIVKDITIKKNKKTIKIKSKKLSQIYIYTNDGNKENVEDYINRNQNYILTFNNPLLVYTSGKLFEDTQLLSNFNSFLDIFVPFTELSKTTTEKGKPQKMDTKFPENTVFSFIEDEFGKKSDYLFCDDLGHECADYISVTDSQEINFFHAKSDCKRLFSASAFHVVVSQALKNIANITNVNNMGLDQKKLKWNKKYSGTNIKMLRKKEVGGDINKAIEMLERSSKSPTTSKKVWLVVDFISKEKLMNEMRKGDKKSLVPIIWLLSSYVTVCQDAGITPYIACKE